MFDISFSELLVVAVVGVLVLRPEDLPALMRRLRDLKRAWQDTSAAVRREVDEVFGAEELREPIRLIEGDDGTLYEAYDVSTLPHHDRRPTIPSRDPEGSQPAQPPH